MTGPRMICLLLALAVCAALFGCGFEVSYDNTTPAQDMFGTSLPNDRIACDLYTVWPLLPIDKELNN